MRRSGARWCLLATPIATTSGAGNVACEFGRVGQTRGDSMQLAHIYVNFPGTTEKAFQFYETVFGTKIGMKQTFGATTFMPNIP
jgi:hypothetical protein